MIQQRELLFVGEGQKGGQGDDHGTGKAHGEPGGVKAAAVQNAADAEIAEAGKEAGYNAGKGLDPAPVGRGHPAGHVGLCAQGVEDLPQGEKDHQHKVEDHLHLDEPVAKQAQNDEGFPQENFPHIPDAP